MRGDVVLVRTFSGRAVKRRVWDVGDTVVYVTNDEQFERLAAGKRAVEPIGFPKEDVFKDTANESGDDTVDWARLAPWNG
jgi:hypothetical protein